MQIDDWGSKYCFPVATSHPSAPTTSNTACWRTALDEPASVSPQPSTNPRLPTRGSLLAILTGLMAVGSFNVIIAMSL